MTTAAMPRAQLDRGYVQSKVIESNLERLETLLSEAGVDLRDDLHSFTRRFGLYVGRLGDACTAAVADERATDTGRRRPTSAAVHR